LLAIVEAVLRPLEMLDALDTLDMLHILDTLEPLELDDNVPDAAVANLEGWEVEEFVLPRWGWWP
jgi:hypothetical protein